MSACFTHMHTQIIVADDKQGVEIRNFLGEKRVRNIAMLEGVTVEESKNVKDQIVIRASPSFLEHNTSMLS